MVNYEKGQRCPLLSLPPEVLGMVSEQVLLLILSVRQSLTWAQIPNSSDLCRLSLVCKTLRIACLPNLYSRLVLRIPTIWSQLSAVEDLISSVGERFRHSRSLCIAPQPTRKDLAAFSNDELLERISDGINYPLAAATIHLNYLVRLLLRRIPKGRLLSFSYV